MTSQALSTVLSPVHTLRDLLEAFGLSDLDLPIDGPEFAERLGRLNDPKSAPLIRSAKELQAVETAARTLAAGAPTLPTWHARINRYNVLKIYPGGSDAVLARAQTKLALGTASDQTLDLVLQTFVQASRKNGVHWDDTLNRLLRFMAAHGPQNELEAMIAMDAAIVQEELAATVQNRSDWVSLAARTNAIAKLARSHSALVDTLRKLRSTGQHRMTVENVTVHAGGQAIVGSVVTPIGASAAGEVSKTAPSPVPQLESNSLAPLVLDGGLPGLATIDRFGSVDRSIEGDQPIDHLGGNPAGHGHPGRSK